ncbi:glutamate--cysteine ligase [Thiohalorhabdus methylotrophus]|uniref:Glutamate--cysteine ligase n=1 Tax=Thiohalorhabdus methylotrophus TaxID=3242694 RepID=A0ABV4TS94_9GAMM
MGREIKGGRFEQRDFDRFARRLRGDTERLRELFREEGFSRHHGVAGYELEAWLVDVDQVPAPINEAFLRRVGLPEVTPELARFNFELGARPRPLGGGVLGAMEAELAANWARCREAAETLEAAPVMIGILPTVTDAMLGLDNMSALERYRALNEQVMRVRRGRPVMLDIQGAEFLHTEHRDVMLEAVTTSFQLHLQPPAERAVRYYNAALVLAGPLVGASANAPFLFGRRLWRETRIPLFEQSVAAGGFGGAAFGPVKRASFGSGYVRHSMLELFEENLAHYPVLLPVELEDPPEHMAHLRLHNGTIWRWVRPLLGFDTDGTPHLRLEHRVVAAGPSVADTLANAALFYGLLHTLAEQPEPPEAVLEFATARENFYTAAKHGLKGSLTWLDGRRRPLAELLRSRLLPQAREGLEDLGCGRSDVERYLGILDERVRRHRTGAAWQIAYTQAHGRDFAALVAAYRRHQDSGAPVHEWPV